MKLRAYNIAAISSILQNLPYAPQIINQVPKALEKEKRPRFNFYENFLLNLKAEFINGQIVVHSPPRSAHLTVKINLAIAIHSFVKQNILAFVFIEKNKNFTPDQIFFTAPDFLVEVISESSDKYVRGVKFIDYALHCVREFWIVDSDNKMIEQYID